MNIMTLNIRGIGEPNKIDWVRKLKFTKKIDFIGIQETRVLDHNTIDKTGCWGSSNFQYECVNPTGNSGGIMCIWDPTVFQKIQSTTNRHFIAITGNWKGIAGNTTLVNVYGPQSITDKRALWQTLIQLKSEVDGVWVFFGDFNAVRFRSERLNSSFCHYSASDFNNFISDAGLQEFNQGGRKFTFLRDDGIKFSKLDRFLVCQNFIQMQPLTSVIVLPREHSDHSPRFWSTGQLLFSKT